FYNLPYHGLLDWRLALDMCRLLSSSAASVNLSTAWGTAGNPWQRLLAGPGAPIPALLQRLGYGPPQAMGPLRGYVHVNPQPRLVLVESHPLWTEQQGDYAVARTLAQQMHPGYDVRPLNPLLAIRRPAEYA